MDEATISNLIRANLRSVMEEKGLKPTPLSLKAGLSRMAVRDILSGQSKNPSYITICKIADAAGVSVDRLTVGPSSLALSDEERQILDLTAQLPASLRRKLLGYGEGLLDARDPDDD